MKLKSIKGRFKPNNPDKYTGDVNKITYRSLWERRFMLYCDRSDQIIEWSSEELHVPYLSPRDGNWHNYYPDFMIRTCDDRTIIVEIKPKHQWSWDINQAKWAFAKEQCKKCDWEFVVLGKKDLYGRGFSYE